VIREHAGAAIVNIEGKEIAVALNDRVDEMLPVIKSDCVIGNRPRGSRVSACVPTERSELPSRSFNLLNL
jgi:hypothetical protein